ncbi:MAG: ABC transporter permease subunit [Roseiflexaceae bacterium]|nr:ABC transporter permease subunit [Roseiflexaceae bacterium]
MSEATTSANAALPEASRQPGGSKGVSERGFSWRTGLLGAHTALMYLFLFAPIVVLVAFSFTADPFGVAWNGFTLEWYTRLFNNTRLIDATFNTLLVATISTAIATLLGTLLALAMEHYRFRGRAATDVLLYLPIVIPEIVLAVALLSFFAFVFNALDALFGLRLRQGMLTVVLAHVTFSIAFVVVTVRTSLRGFDRRLEEAAMDLGANRWNTFRRITFPLILPGIIGGALLAFTLSLDDFIISLFVSGPGTLLLPVEVYNRVKRAVTPEINAISTLMLLFSMVLVLLSQLAQRQRK